MGGMSMHASGAMSMWTRMPGQTWPGFAASFLGMWMTMMVPMMIPPFAIALWRSHRAALAFGIRPLGASRVWIGVGYFGVWSAIGVLCLPLVAIVAATGVGGPTSRLVIGAVACAVQLMHWSKRLATAFREAPASKRLLRGEAFGTRWQYGVCLGLHCVRNCAPLMIIGLAFTAMDFRAMTVTTLLASAERLAGRDVAVRD